MDTEEIRVLFTACSAIGILAGANYAIAPADLAEQAKRYADALLEAHLAPPAPEAGLQAVKPRRKKEPT